MSRKRFTAIAIEALYYLCLIGFLWYMSSNTHPPLRPWFWHTLMRTCNRIAYAAGRVAIQAEVAYGVAIEKVRQ